MACTGCSDDSGSESGGTTGGTGAPASTSTAGDGGPASTDTMAAADSSTGAASEGSGGSSSGSSGGGSSSTGSAVDCELLAPIADPPNPQPMAGACGYALPSPNEACGAQPVPGTQVCAAFFEAFDPSGIDKPDMTDWRCAQASSGGYCLELQPGLYSFCTMPVTTFEQYEAECIPCLIEIPEDGAVEISWQDGPTWDAPDCAEIGGGSSTG